MGQPRFSIIVPTRDRSAQLGTCLEAIARLDYPREELEVIVIDDGGRRPIEERSLPRDRIELRLHRQPNRGPASARNVGASLAGGELLVFVDDDVVLSPDWLQQIDRASSARPSAALGGAVLAPRSAGRCALASEAIVDLATGRRGQEPNGNGDAPVLRFLPSNNLVLPAAGFHSLGGFDPAFRVSEDRELCRRWVASGRELRYVPGATCVHLKRLTVAGFARQHFRYGEGAFRYQRARADRDGLAGVLEPSFYRGVLRECGLAVRRGDLARVGLLALWQLANAAGFATVAIRARLRASLRPRGDS